MWNWLNDGYDTNENVDMHVDRHHMFSSHWTIEVSIGGNVAATATKSTLHKSKQLAQGQLA